MVILDDSQIGDGFGAGRKDYDVSGDQLGGINFGFLMISDDLTMRGDEFLQLFDGLMGAKFLHKSKEGINEDE